MAEAYPAEPNDLIDPQSGYEDSEPPVLYKQISYEELEELVLAVRDSISEFYLAPQGEISFAAVEAALKGQIMPPAHDAHAGGTPAQATYAAAPPVQVPYTAGTAAYGPFPDGAPSGEPYTDGAEPAPDAGELPSDEAVTADAPPHESGGIDETGPGAQANHNGAQANHTGVQAIRAGGALVKSKLRLPYANTAPMRQIYRESIKKRAQKRRAAMLKYLAACFGGTVFGGLLMLLCVTWVFPFFGLPISVSAPSGVHEVIHTYEYKNTDSQIEAIYEKVTPSVAGIRVTADYSSSPFGRRQMLGDGSGIIISPDGYILTSNNVVSATVPLYMPILPGSETPGRRDRIKLEVVIQRDPDIVYPATLVARDVRTDVAIIKIDAVNLPVAELGDSDQLKPGEMVIAIGRPDGMDNICSVTDGIISGFNRDETSLIQTNAAINAGNSGGALVNARGQIVGVNVITAESSGYGGLGYAIPINAARSVAENLLSFNYVKGRAKTGVRYSEDFNDNFELYRQQYPDIPQGVYVEYVEPLSGAFKAGVRTGDIITKMGGEDISDYTEMLAILDTLAPGDIVDVEVFRGGELLELEIEVSEETGDTPD